MKITPSKLSRKLIPCALIVLVTFALAGKSHAATLLTWDTDGLTGDEASLAATALPNVEASNLTRGAGLNASSPIADTFTSRKWVDGNTSTSDKTYAVTNDRYITFTAEASSGYELNLSSINLQLSGKSSKPTDYQWAYKIGGAAQVFIAGDGAFTPGTDAVTLFTTTLSGITALQGVSDTVEFRLYGWGSPGQSGAANVGAAAGNDLVLNGSVSAIPEPQTALLLGISLMAVMIFRPRQRVR